MAYISVVTQDKLISQMQLEN